MFLALQLCHFLAWTNKLMKQIMRSVVQNKPNTANQYYKVSLTQPFKISLKKMQIPACKTWDFKMIWSWSLLMVSRGWVISWFSFFIAAVLPLRILQFIKNSWIHLLCQSFRKQDVVYVISLWLFKLFIQKLTGNKHYLITANVIEWKIIRKWTLQLRKT